jgi:hypothetical protein
MPHNCKNPRCDGTKLGHSLAMDFPKETQRIDDAFAHMAAVSRGDAAKLEIEYCEEFNVVRQGICDRALMPDGSCPYVLEHGDHLAQ